MGPGRDFSIFKGIKLFDLPDCAQRPGRGAIDGLIEVAVKNASPVVDADQAAAHEMGKRLWIEVLHEKIHVVRVLPVSFKLMTKPFEWHVSQADEMIEGQSEALAEGRLILFLQRGLVGGETGPIRVVDQHETALGVPLSIAELIQTQEGCDTAVVDPPAALLLYIFGFVTGQRSDDFDAVLGEEFGGVLLPGFIENREVATVDYAFFQFSCGLNELAKVFVEFWGASRDVQGFNSGTRREQFYESMAVTRREPLSTLGAGLNMAMMASQVAAQPDVDLKGTKGLSAQRAVKRLVDPG